MIGEVAEVALTLLSDGWMEGGIQSELCFEADSNGSGWMDRGSGAVCLRHSALATVQNAQTHSTRQTVGPVHWQRWHEHDHPSSRDQDRTRLVVAAAHPTAHPVPDEGSQCYLRHSLPLLPTHSSAMDGHNPNNVAVSDLRAQVRDISDLAREYRAQIQLLTSELSDFRRREPLVQLLWFELAQVKGALDAAIAAGFTYDCGEVSGRYVDMGELRGLAEVNGLDVVRLLEGDGGMRERSKLNHTHSRIASHIGADSGAILDDFIPVSHAPQSSNAEYDTPQPPHSTAQPTNSADNSRRPSSPPFVPSAPSSDIPLAPSDVPAPPPLAPGAPPAPGAPSLAPAVIPTKPVVQPTKKMKAIHWQRIILTPAQHSGRPTVWKDVESVVDVPFDVDELTARFSDLRGSVKATQSRRATVAADEEKEAVAQPPKEVRILSDKRFNAVSIMMTSLPTVDTVVQAIRQLDTTRLTRDQVAALRKNMLDDSEQAALQTVAAGTVGSLSRPDSFMRQLSLIEGVGARLDCWHFQLNFNDLMEEITLPLTVINAAIQAIRHSSAFRTLLALVLTAGNYMNGGSARGQADGFELSILHRLASLRDNTNQSSLLLFLLTQAAQRLGDGWLLTVEEQLSPVVTAADFPLKQALSASGRFTALTRTMKNTATLVCASVTDQHDPFLSVFASFNSDADSRTRQLDEDSKRLQTAYSELLVWLSPNAGEGKGVMTNEELFGLIATVCSTVRELRLERKETAEEEAKQKRMDDAKRVAAAVRAKAAGSIVGREEMKERGHESSGE